LSEKKEKAPRKTVYLKELAQERTATVPHLRRGYSCNNQHEGFLKEMPNIEELSKRGKKNEEKIERRGAWIMEGDS